MAMRAVKLFGETCAPVLGTVRHFTASRNLWDAGAKPVPGPGAHGNEGFTDMDSGERESPTDGSESPQDKAASMKHHEDAGKTDSAEELKGKPLAQVGVEKVREELAGSSR